MNYPNIDHTSPLDLTTGLQDNVAQLRKLEGISMTPGIDAVRSNEDDAHSITESEKWIGNKGILSKPCNDLKVKHWRCSTRYAGYWKHLAAMIGKRWKGY